MPLQAPCGTRWFPTAVNFPAFRPSSSAARAPGSAMPHGAAMCCGGAIRWSSRFPASSTAMSRRCSGPARSASRRRKCGGWRPPWSSPSNLLIAEIRPGRTAEDVHRMSVENFARHGYRVAHRSGYSVGVNYAPDWGEGNLFSIVEGETRAFEPGMVFHLVPGIYVPPGFRRRHFRDGDRHRDRRRGRHRLPAASVHLLRVAALCGARPFSGCAPP